MTLRLAFLTVFLISACGLGYQLIAGSVSSYLLGDSITQFSLTIGIYLFALGIGSYLSRFVGDGLVYRFIQVELAVSLAGGFSACLLMLAYTSPVFFRPILYTNIIVVGTLVGIEIPILMRILKDEMDFKDLLAKVLAFDYVGALMVAVVFPLTMVPALGLVRSALALGLLNAVVGLFSTYLFGPRLRHTLGLRIQSVLAIILLCVGLWGADRWVRSSENEMYLNEVVWTKTTPYQRIVVTRGSDEFQLFLNGGLQFSSGDEYRYHEALVHPAMVSVEEPRRILVLGGGDGLALREIFKHPAVERITLVDIDPAVVQLGREFGPLRDLNQRSLNDPRVTVVHDDAMKWIETNREIWDVVIIDFPDPHSFSLGKLYSRSFYRTLAKRLAPDGAMGIQSTNPREAPRSFWCIAKTLEEAEYFVRPYHATVPAFGVWGFMLAAKRKLPIPTRVPKGCRFLTAEYLPGLFLFPKDMERREVEGNQLNTQQLVRYYESEYDS